MPVMAIPESSIPKPGYLYNWNDCPSGTCALELCGPDSDLDLCESSVVCNSETPELYGLGISDRKECSATDGSLDIITETVACYPVVEASCDTSTCEVVTEEICTLDTSSNNCWTLCTDDESNCELVCDESDYTCTTQTTYRNCHPSCNYTATQVCSERYSVDLTQSLTCKSDMFAQCNGFGCGYVEYCGGMHDGTADYLDGCSGVPSLFAHELYCEDITFCEDFPCDSSKSDDHIDNLFCYPEYSDAYDQVNAKNFDFLVRDSTGYETQCSPAQTIEAKGQPFCPPGFIASPDTNGEYICIEEMYPSYQPRLLSLSFGS